MTRFKFHRTSELKTGLKFNFVFKDINDNNLLSVSLLEEDAFTIEPIFYRFFSSYSNYGHWGKHTINKEQLSDFEILIKNYVDYLNSMNETNFYIALTEKNFGPAYLDIAENRAKVVDLALQFIDFLKTMPVHKLEIHGI